jgi:hypothetical protein
MQKFVDEFKLSMKLTLASKGLTMRENPLIEKGMSNVDMVEQEQFLDHVLCSFLNQGRRFSS